MVHAGVLYTHEHLLLLVSEIIRLFEVSQVSISQKQALVNAIKYVCALTL
jgi:hypothetical protein